MSSRVYRPSCIGLSPFNKPTLTQLLSKAKTKFLLTSRNLSGTEEKKQYDVLLLHVSQICALIDSLQSPELRALNEELEQRTELIESKKIEASDLPAKAGFSTPDNTAVSVVTHTLKDIHNYNKTSHI